MSVRCSDARARPTSRQARPASLHSTSQVRGPARGLGFPWNSLRLRGGYASGDGAEGGDRERGNGHAGGQCSEVDVEAIKRAVEDIKSRIPTDEALAMAPAAPTPLEADPQAEEKLRQILESFQVTSEGNDRARRSHGRACSDSNDDNEEEEDEDEYGPITLHSALWHPAPSAEPEPAAEQLKSILPRQLLPSARPANGTRAWRHSLGGAFAMQVARTWPEKCGAHLVRGIPEIETPAQPAELKKVADRYFRSAYYRDRLEKLLALVAHHPFISGLAEVRSIMLVAFAGAVRSRLLRAQERQRENGLDKGPGPSTSASTDMH
jgi:hypothetical protein